MRYSKTEISDAFSSFLPQLEKKLSKFFDFRTAVKQWEINRTKTIQFHVLFTKPKELQQTRPVLKLFKIFHLRS